MQSTTTYSTEKHSTLLALVFILPLLATVKFAYGGGACAIAKELGNSLAIEWIAANNETAHSAGEKAKAMLRQKGFKKRKLMDLHIQASTSLNKGYMIIIKSKYKTRIGKERTSYGCGFSPVSSTVAEKAAIKNLSSYSWGWKGEFGYELHARHEY